MNTLRFVALFLPIRIESKQNRKKKLLHNWENISEELAFNVFGKRVKRKACQSVDKWQKRCEREEKKNEWRVKQDRKEIWKKEEKKPEK